MNLYDVSNDLFIYLTTFRWRVDAGVNLPMESVQKDILQLFNEQEIKIRQNPSLSLAYNQVKYALVVFTDEMILNSDWEHRNDWYQSLLEARFFGTNVGGDRFFELCEDLTMDTPEVAAIYYHCLTMGLKGRYEAGAEELQLVKRELLKKNPKLAAMHNEKLASHSYQLSGVRKRRKLPAILKWQHIVFVIIILVAVYIALDRFIIWHHLTTDIDTVRNQAAVSLKTGGFPSTSFPSDVLARRTETEPELTEPAAEPELTEPTTEPELTEPAAESKLTEPTAEPAPPEPTTESKLTEPAGEPEFTEPAVESDGQLIGNVDINKNDTGLKKLGDALSFRDMLTLPARDILWRAIESLTPPPPPPTPTPAPPPPLDGYTIQVGAGFSETKSIKLLNKLKDKGYEPYLVKDKKSNGRILYLIHLDYFKVGSIKIARKAANKFQRREKMKVFVTNYIPPDSG